MVRTHAGLPMVLKTESLMGTSGMTLRTMTFSMSTMQTRHIPFRWRGAQLPRRHGMEPDQRIMPIKSDGIIIRD